MIKVFVSGCYDIIHGGHIEFFTQAKNLGDYLVVSFANDEALLKFKGRKTSLPLNHKKRLLESISVIDKVVVGEDIESGGLDFTKSFLEEKPDILAVTDDDKYGDEKRKLCERTNTKYIVLPKTLNFEKVSTTDIINWIKSPKEISLRVDFGGSWLDVPRFSREGAYVVNCAISPFVSINKWEYEIGSGLGGSAAYAVLAGKDAIESELGAGVGWQDPAIISESGLCVWRSGIRPVLDIKVNPDWLNGKMAILWTGKSHETFKLTDNKRDYDLIAKSGAEARDAVIQRDIKLLANAINTYYQAQLQEGMEQLPNYNEISRRYCGSGFGGYAVYLFSSTEERKKFLEIQNTKIIEPYIR